MSAAPDLPPPGRPSSYGPVLVLLLGLSGILQLTVMAGLFLGRDYATWTALGLGALLFVGLAVGAQLRARRRRHRRRR